MAEARVEIERAICPAAARRRSTAGRRGDGRRLPGEGPNYWAELLRVRLAALDEFAVDPAGLSPEATAQSSASCKGQPGSCSRGLCSLSISL